MARHNHPEQTIERIVEASAKLFIEKGYDQTSIQDILDTLKLSKGGLYHHFKSKDEILEAVLHKRSQYITDFLSETIQRTKASNGKEKLKKILYHLGTDPKTHALDGVIAGQINNPYFVVRGIQTCVKQDATMISGLIKEGIHDGSIMTKQPDYCAEIFLLLLNYWANPSLFGRNKVETKERLYYLQFVMDSLGVDILDDNLIEVLLNEYETMHVF